MKKNRSILIMAVALLVIIAAFAIAMIWQKNKPGDADDTTLVSLEPIEPLAKFERTDVDSIEVRNEDGTFQLKNETVTITPTPAPTETGESETTVAEETEDQGPLTKEQWTLAEPELMNADQESIDQIGNSLLTLSIVEDITEQAKDDLETYGLKEPSAEATYTMKDGKTLTVQLGDSLAESDKYYAYRPDTKRIVVVTSAARPLLQDVKDFGSSLIFPFPDVQKVTQFSLQRKSDGWNVEIEGIPADKTDKETVDPMGNPQVEVPNTWMITSPLEREADQTKFPELLQQIISLTVTEHVDLTDEKASEYGLGDPEYVIEVASADEAIKLEIGKSAGNDTNYARASNHQGIFKITASALSKIGMAPIDFVNGFVALENISTVGSIEAELDGQKIEAEVFSPSPEEKEKDKDIENRYVVNGRNANIVDERDRNYFSNFYQHLIGVMGRGMDLEAKPALKDPQFSFKLIKRDDSEDVQIDVVPRDKTTWYLFRNGEYTGLYTDKDDLYGYMSKDRMGLMASVERLLNAVEHQQSGYYEHPPMSDAEKAAAETEESTSKK